VRAGGAGQVLQRLQHAHSALAVADQHRHQAVAFVVPGDAAGDLAAVHVAAGREAAVARSAQRVGRITHRDQEARERRHRHRRQASVQQHDARRRRAGEHLDHLEHVGRAQPGGVEGEQSGVGPGRVR
jgi:hypothetical protein